MSFTKTVFLPVEPAEAFELITQPERLRRWMTISARIDVRAGGDFRWTVVPGAHAAGTVIEVEPGRRISFAFGWEGSEEVAPGSSDLSLTLEPADGGTNLTLVHAGLSPEQEAMHAQGWTHYLGRLVALAESGDAGLDVWEKPEDFDQLNGADASFAVLSRVLTAIGAEAAGLPTPCSDFTVAALTDHLRGSIVSIAKALGAALPDDDANAPAEVRIAAVAQPTLEAFARHGLGGELDMGFAVLPAAFVGNILNLEFLVHAWDYATALGRPLEVTPELSEYILGLAKATISDQVRAGGSFAEETVVDESAHALDRLVAFTGRVPVRG
ncbi:TIGR03086 family metal-binding protein [Sinomonas sp. JGH33]|uniref:TIGR03086 family metal-binding protein n=1 Tax=Sinomonas terricola TaxID=3110330 RepID=A0ABU5T7M8_9MICC|nr:TIGR03086 family metal-binding protein [Sinomonas sp. JGH33]MEA5455679.1 TIGR03086 family metal-binding protein [Sinomonas sp. JGH33]